MKYIKKYNENIDWGFEEDETPVLDNIYDIENYKIIDLYKIFNKNR